MKNITLFFVLISACYSQNPDGNSISLHITPYLTTGNADFSTINFTPRYSSSGNLIAYSKSSSDISFNQKPNFNFSALVKIPTSDTFTLSLFASKLSTSLLIENPPDASKLNYTVTSKNNTYSFGSTFSFYFK